MIDTPGRESYDPNFFQPLSEIEDRHFWFRSRNQIIRDCVRRLASGNSGPLRILEVGCGTGYVLRMLTQVCPTAMIVGMDLFAEGLRYAKRRSSAMLVRGDLHRPPFTGQFDMIGLFDVLEHSPDDREVLNGLRGLLRYDGTLLLTVPAHPALWSYFDEGAHHHRRYQPSELRGKLMEAGYDIEYATQYMMSTLPLLWMGRHLSSLGRRVSRRQSGGPVEHIAAREFRPVPVINGLLCWILGIEAHWLASARTLPLGSSLLVVARRGQP